MPPSRPAPGWSVGKWIAAILAIAVHLAFVVFLIVSVNWQNREAEPVSVELYAPPKEAAPAPPPKPEPEPEPPKPAPEPPKPPPEPPKPAPKAEPPPPTKAEIALKEKQEKERRKEQADRERKEKERVEAEKKKVEEKRLAEVRERQAREAEALKAQAQREQVAVADAAKARANADYIRRIQAKVKGNVVVPPEIAGNPEAIFDVVQLPTGEIIDAQLKKSSGNRAYDEAVQRAIIKASPLPRPDSPDLFQRNLTLKFRPLD
ncbi:MAG TPA: energy transducer TonB [Casimicrobiaceae bacterium]|nr:energy transducer TonB [Casimicrobiaceae bacterium]